MPTRTDQYFVVRAPIPHSSALSLTQPEDSKIEVKYLPRGTLQVVETIYGHVGGGGGGSKEDDRVIAEAVRKLLA